MDTHQRADFDSLLPKTISGRRGFIVTSLGAGFALAVQPVSAQTLHGHGVVAAVILLMALYAYAVRPALSATVLGGVRREVYGLFSALAGGFLQGEPGVDPDRIGSWSSSNGGTVSSALIGVDGRLKATVIHVMGQAPGRGR